MEATAAEARTAMNPSVSHAARCPWPFMRSRRRGNSGMRAEGRASPERDSIADQIAVNVDRLKELSGQLSAHWSR